MDQTQSSLILSSTGATGGHTVSDSTPKALSLSIRSAGDEQRLDAIAAQQTDNMQWLHKVTESVSHMADEMARTQLLLACEIAAASVSASCTTFQRKADSHQEEADRLAQDILSKVRPQTSSH